MPIHGYPGNVITANPTAPTSSVASGVWTTEQQLLAVSQGNWPGYEYPIANSLRFNSADSAYLNRTFGTPTNPDKLTISFWVKRGAISSSQYIWGSNNSGTNDADLYFNASDQLVISSSAGSVNLNLITTQVFRDPSAWYHIVVAIDTTQATSSDRAKLYVNGVQVTAFGTATYPAQNTDITFNRAYPQFLGCRTNSLGNFFNGYLTEVNFIDGQALEPSSFGLNDPETGVWSPKRYTGTYGTNGFYLNFSDNSGTTSTTLGKDYSGNGNNWTPNNFSVTAGAGNDSLVDTPTAYGTDTGVGGEVRGNYCTLNPLDVSANTLSNGNLDITYATNSDTNRGGTIAVSTGKWYFEATVQAVGGTYAIIGVTSGVATATALGTSAYQYSYISSTGNKFNNNSSTAYGNTYTTGDVIGVALDMDNGKVWFSKNGTFQASGDPAAGTNQAFSGLSGSFSPAINARNNSIVNLNCGQRAFAYTAPSGFKALCTQNLPTPTIGATSTTQANDYFNVLTYNGSATSQNITGVGFSPDLVWIKTRSNAESHQLVDQVRGATKALMSNETSAETTWTNGLSAFLSDGFTLPGGNNRYSDTGYTYVAWNWKANGAGSSNTAGTITSTVSANTTSGFSIATFTTTGVAATIGHGLGVAPRMVIMKDRTNVASWLVYHASLASAANYLVLNATDASASNTTVWNNTAPTSTVFSIGTVWAASNYVAYCFAAVAGYSAFGSYTGNGSADGPFVYLGFRPAFLMLKRTDSTGDWMMKDFRRDGYNVVKPALFANLSDAEYSDALNLDLISNGFKLRNAFANSNANTGTYIYMAFAEFPFKYSLAE